MSIFLSLSAHPDTHYLTIYTHHLKLFKPQSDQLLQSMEDLDRQEFHHQLQVKTAFARYGIDTQSSYHSLFSSNKLNKYLEILRQQKKLQLVNAIKANQAFLDLILKTTHEHTQSEFIPFPKTTCTNASKMRSTIKQFYRQWCSQSVELNDYLRIVGAFERYLKKKSRILVPGCGMGRLVLQLVSAGFGAEGNQVTYFMLFCSNFMLNVCQKKQQYEIYPFIHSMATYQSQDMIFRSIKIPDKVAIEIVPEDADFSMAAGQFTDIYNAENQRGTFDGVATCFFLDTANNILNYIDTICNVLRPGAIWINFGPLLYHYRQFQNQISIELSWQSLKQYISNRFDFIEEQFIQTSYCHDPNNNYTAKYKCVFSVCKIKQRQQDNL